MRGWRSVTDAREIVGALTDIDNRIRALQLVHDCPDRQRHLELVDADVLLAELCGLMQEAICPPGVTIAHEVTPLQLHISDATPLCLLINELVTNSVRHAFRPGETGPIEIRFHRNGVDKLELYLGDSGNGGSDAWPADATSGQGQRIVEAIGVQLGGALARERGPGVAWSLVFPPSDAATLATSSHPGGPAA